MWLCQLVLYMMRTKRHQNLAPLCRLLHLKKEKGGIYPQIWSSHTDLQGAILRAKAPFIISSSGPECFFSSTLSLMCSSDKVLTSDLSHDQSYAKVSAWGLLSLNTVWDKVLALSQIPLNIYSVLADYCSVALGRFGVHVPIFTESRLNSVLTHKYEE